MNKDDQKELITKINKMQPEEIKNFVLRLASLDDNLAGVILTVLNDEPIEASHPDREAPLANGSSFTEVDQEAVERDIRRIRGLVSNSIRETVGNTDYLTPKKTEELTEFFNHLVKRFQDGYKSGEMPIELTVPLLLMLYQNQIQLLPKVVGRRDTFEDGCNGVLSALEEVIGNGNSLSANKKNRLMQQVIKLFKKNIFQGFPQERYDLFYATLPLVTEETAPKMLTVSNKLKKQASILDMIYLESNQIILKLRIALILGHKDEAQQIIDDNITNDNVRLEYVSILEAQKKYAKAEEVIQDALTNNVGDRRMWRFQLGQIYELTNQINKLKQLLKDDLMSGNIQVYKEYKDLLVKNNEWKHEYPQLLTELEDNLGRYDYCEILLQEKEYTKLIDQLKKYNSMVMIRKYAPEIYQSAKIPVTDLYLKSVVIPQSNKKTVTGPAQLASDISKFLNFSGDLKTTKKWVHQLRARLGDNEKFRDAFDKMDDSISRYSPHSGRSLSD
ncbi:tetratricopeptide repeat protein [Lentilactobacillus buchneri]|uniref:Uncharacterized protein n=1 Tax=Lentilactobacillus buchneri subsp. silagei CD034 TaxID=1071400 RepID=J9W0H8_LENBU|nr:hypothetical protein [Lentilactobacillus buchneri]MCC6100730.1 hypothetical protein [Lactobacillus sp.]AFR99236.1 hypothetical protein LBUCD034_0126 [Lentilactobacillus buchneri subsp. silagei CD034]BEJ52768.1 hypothetical protein Ltb232_09440 [Lentilactobacillus buchneri subsp. silagei]GED91204.1 hypothetical protein LBSG162_03090 [Lentilactobacillus buchneri subsp. silagei]GED94205.1 hypothetical protein LBSP_07650 [Lentilactobacillus buchneri subsp. silagei]